jgi:hypothetical protein
MDVFTAEGLEWSLTHVRKYGDTDIFPVPFEYDAIAHDWNSIKPYFQGLDFGNYKIRADRRIFVVKPGGGFRAAVQLDPLDHLIYTTAVYEAAEYIEKARVPADKRIACSYRIKLGSDGTFFQEGSGWKDFHEHSRSLVSSGEYSHVLVADIADFFNQLGQHRIQNALELSAVPLLRSQNIERFLNQLTSKQSQGLPVGPLGSNILSEASLIDVDNFLLRQGSPHVRYVDDFRIFCRSRKQAVELRHALTEYLFEVHRLSLETSKSAILYVDKFVSEELADPQETEEAAHFEKMRELLLGFQDERGGYWLEGVDEEEHDKLLTQAQRESLTELFSDCVSRPPLRLGLARHLLKTARRSRTTVLNNLVFENLQGLAPALRDVVGYLAVTIPKNSAKERGRELLEFAKVNDVGGLPFVNMWLIELILRRPDLCECSTALSLAANSSAALGVRPQALMAAAYNQVDWIRSKKETWRNNEPWDRRAIIWSASKLPSGEKRPFLSMVLEQGDVLDAAVAKWLMSQA